MMHDNLKISTVGYIALSELVRLVPDDCDLMSDPPFTWGDCDLSLVSVEVFRDYVDGFFEGLDCLLEVLADLDGFMVALNK